LSRTNRESRSVGQQIDSTFLEELALGATILGAGGGDTAVPMLMAQRALESYGPIELIPLNAVPDDEWLIPPAIVRCADRHA
jgi:DUF917 family protein